MEYWNSQFPSLGGRGNSDEGFGNMEEHGDDEDNEESDRKSGNKRGKEYT